MSFKDDHSGERCFIVGNGPSLKITPLHLLEGEVSFAMNYIAHIFNDTTWRPTFYLCCKIIKRYINPEQLDLIQKAVDVAQLSYISSVIGDMGVRGAVVYKEVRVEPNGQEKWQDDFRAHYIYSWSTQMYPTFQIAVMMGFKKIYLLGVDLHSLDGGQAHFYQDIPSFYLRNFASKNDSHIQCHELIKSECTKRGVEVYNATIGGELEVYERVNISDLLR